MIDILGVAENPKMAETIAISLSKGRFEQDNEVSSSNPFYSFPFRFQDKLQNFKLVSTNGVIFIGDLERSIGDLVSSLKNNFQYTIPMKEIILISNIKKLSYKAKKIIVFANCSLNGDLYAYHISTLFEKPVLRPIFYSISRLGLEESIFSMKNLNNKYALSCLFDFESRYRFSNIITNFLNTYLLNNLKSKSNSVILNPLNLTILSIIYNNNYEQDSCSSEYYTIEIKFLKDNVVYTPKWLRGNLFCKITTFTLYSNIFNGNTQLKVISKEFNIIEKMRPLPLNYRKLLKIASKYLKITYDDVEKYSKELYNEGFISYPFTDSTKYSSEFDFLGTAMNLIGYPPVSNFASSLKKKIDVPRVDENPDIENVNQNVPIYPSNIFQGDINTPKGQIFCLIARHFLASLAESLYINEYIINLQISEEIFQLKYQQIDQKNEQYCWYTIFPFKNFVKEEVPDFTENEVFTVKSIKLVSVKNPPIEINELTLLKILQSKGIGGKEVIDGISNLIASNLVKKTSKGLKTTDFASALVISFEEIGFDFRDTYFLSSFAEAAQQIREDNISDAQNKLLKKFYAMIQEIQSKSQTFNSIIDLILSPDND